MPIEIEFDAFLIRPEVGSVVTMKGEPVGVILKVEDTGDPGRFRVTARISEDDVAGVFVQHDIRGLSVRGRDPAS